jgi:peptidoglycan/xylan/chitin deacetylase (PgdA/CDA1 family)
MEHHFNEIFSLGQWLPLIHRLPGRERSVALSFDDGPTPTTTLPLISLLAKYKARATFFLSGNRAVMHPELVKVVIDSGHDIYGHGWEHIRLDEAGPERLLADLEKTESFLRGFRPTPSPYLVRLPYGAGRRKAWVHQTIRKWSPTAQVAYWSHSLKDWDLAIPCRNRAELDKACLAAANSLEHSWWLKGAVVLLHESPHDRPAPLTSEVAPILVEMILERFASRGFAFVPMMPRKRVTWISRFVIV